MVAQAIGEHFDAYNFVAVQVCINDFLYRQIDWFPSIPSSVMSAVE